ncbi:hypothetical protein KO500_01375 [Cellulophaga baltica]|uniref:hypothetical protein n=1 Tax=Cellulophaga TaxID=104264 RepID=UPI001C07BFAD|nr:MULTISPECIES: hypothetical protein [Cellulophaga]MBU2995060.1 hypothetical protein [Cellulophaga baltica]MDO6766455.1 hypothetical protein [Cellulophaga sp. 1_MG-2023]
MKFKITLIVLGIFFISCSNDKKSTESPKQFAKIKSDLLLSNSTTKLFSNTTNNDTLTVLINGKSLLNSIATFKVINSNGEEIFCDTISTTQLLSPDYRTANSALKDVQIRETVANLFTTEEYSKYFKNNL